MDRTDEGKVRADRIGDALNQLAVNDENKVEVAGHGFATVFVRMLRNAQSCECELDVASKALWLVAFKVKDEVVETPGCLEGKQRQHHCISYDERANIATCLSQC